MKLNVQRDYKDLRKDAYKSIEEQLDLIYWDSKNLTNKWEEHIDDVKTTYPKTGEQ